MDDEQAIKEAQEWSELMCSLVDGMSKTKKDITLPPTVARSLAQNIRDNQSCAKRYRGFFFKALECLQRFKIPTHGETLITAAGESLASVSYPVEKQKGRFYCKYCDSVHRQWWAMSKEDYDRDDIILCARCEHTSIKEYTEVEEQSNAQTDHSI